MVEQFNFGKAIENTAEGLVVIEAGPELIEKALEEFAPEYIASSLEAPPIPGAETAIAGAQAVAIPVATALVAFYGVRHMVSGLTNKNKKHGRA